MANLKSIWKNFKIKAKNYNVRDKKEILKTGGGGPSEPMDKISEKIFDLIPNQFAAIESELVDAFAPFLTSFVLQLLRHSSRQHPFAKVYKVTTRKQ
ncbi:hypothetical protein PoB_001874100 [Plakobranchus ocellatus]|uniref:Uncharacterized protein n=1 Tax=Plakobranchus ocellatus TaxID=259542 RepID=A0AAV3Z8K4_9GAST|nr:hypothetical protein PoB_001874100 [Plakobranchus ocellatus]